MSNYKLEKYYIFFDVDGVLNCKNDWVSRFTVNEDCIKVFALLKQKLQKKYDPVFIITSTWRAGIGKAGENNALQYDLLKKKLSEYEITISAATPVSNKGRQREIEYYLKRFCENTEHYIILDDDRSLFEKPDDIRLYITDYRTGLINKDIGKILKLIKQTMDNRKEKEMYQQIVNKLGFEPKNYKPTLKNMENDNENNPFDILTLEELKYLKRNNYFINIDMEN